MRALLVYASNGTWGGGMWLQMRSCFRLLFESQSLYILPDTYLTSAILPFSCYNWVLCLLLLFLCSN